MNIEGNSYLVIGMARSGVAAAEALFKRGGAVTVYDAKSREQLAETINGLSAGITVLAGIEPDLKAEYFDMAIVSPGVPLDTPLLLKIKDKDIPVIGEVELAYRLKKPATRIIAITGTNGKTTTTALVADILTRAGISTMAAGNIGVPLLKAVEAIEDGIIACEMSSFQLETIDEFHPIASGIINITPDHLDRHKTMENYAAIKMRISRNQQESEAVLLNADDPWLADAAVFGRRVLFSALKKLDKGVYVDQGMIIADLAGKPETICRCDELRLRGMHNLENALCAVGLTRAAGVDPEFIKKSLMNFGGVRHRLEEVRMLDGVLYINDSKGTNPDSTIKALGAFQEPIVLIAGGRNKGSDFTALMELAVKKVKSLVLVGEAKRIMKDKAIECGITGIIETETFDEAVHAARSQTKPGDVVLLSPACASWDMFNNYEERGDLFCEIVRSF